MIVPVMVPRPPDRLAPPMTAKSRDTLLNSRPDQQIGYGVPGITGALRYATTAAICNRSFQLQRGREAILPSAVLSVHRGLAMLVRLIDVAFKECQQTLPHLGLFFAYHTS